MLSMFLYCSVHTSALGTKERGQVTDPWQHTTTHTMNNLKMPIYNMSLWTGRKQRTQWNPEHTRKRQIPCARIKPQPKRCEVNMLTTNTLCPLVKIVLNYKARIFNLMIKASDCKEIYIIHLVYFGQNLCNPWILISPFQLLFMCSGHSVT